MRTPFRLAGPNWFITLGTEPACPYLAPRPLWRCALERARRAGGRTLLRLSCRATAEIAANGGKIPKELTD